MIARAKWVWSHSTALQCDLEHPVRKRTRDTTPSLTNTVSDCARGPIFNAEAVALLSRISQALEQLLAIYKPMAGLNPVDHSAPQAGSDEGDLRRVWLQLSPEERAILEFCRLKDNHLLTYLLIAEGVVVPRLPGSMRREVMSERTVAKHCHAMERPPLALIQRLGERRGVRLTAKGDRLVRLYARQKNFS